MTRDDRAEKEREPAARQAGHPTGEGDTTPTDPEQLRREIQENREDLGETVEALVERADVRSQLQGKMSEGKESLQDAQAKATQKTAALAKQARERRVSLLAAAGAVVLALIVLWLIRRE